ncbi:MAG: hypothetical protein QM296_03345 [Bacillota bacterium]|nr:hypothetical protein [Bacillota bacterium]
MQVVKRRSKQLWTALLFLLLTVIVVQSNPARVSAAAYASFDNPANRGESVGLRRAAYSLDVEISWVRQGENAVNVARNWGYNIPNIPLTEEFYLFKISYRVYQTKLDSYPASNNDLKVYVAPESPYNSNTLLNVAGFDYNYAITPASGWVSKWIGVVAPKGSNPYLVYTSPVDNSRLVWQIKTGYPPLSIDSFEVVGGEGALIAGNEITIACNVSGGSNQWPTQLWFDYFIEQISYDGERTVAEGSRPGKNISFVPEEAGDYCLRVIVANGDEFIEKQFEFQVRNLDPLAVAVFRSGWSDTYDLGQTIDLAARGQGGVPPYRYQFYVLRSNGERVNFRRTPVSSNIYPWTPATPDTYTLGVDIYDAADQKVTQEKTITVKNPVPLSIATFRTGWSDSYEPGQTINLAARGEGGTAPYKYQFYVLRSNGNRVNFRRTPVSSNIYPWTPVTSDTYTLGVDVYDATGRKVTQEKTVTVKAPTPLSIAVFRAGWSDTYRLGQTIDLAARGEGGTAPYKYQFYVLRSNGARVNFRKTPVSSNIYPWTPVTPDTYTLGVDVYDASGKKVTLEKTITVLPGQ